MRHLDLFSGIGGFALAARNVGWQTVAFCESEPFCQAVLRKHWPDVPIHNDVRELTADAVGPVDIITGGYPCQPFSYAGERRGEADDRHLWPHFARLIREHRPRWAVGENVAGHVTLGLDDVLADLEGLGYAWEAFVIPACAVDARHRRDRVWIVADRDGGTSELRREPRDVYSARDEAQSGGAWPEGEAPHAARDGCADAPDAERERLEGAEFLGERIGEQSRPRDVCGAIPDDGRRRSEGTRGGERCGEEPTRWEPEPDVGRVAHGIPDRLDRLRALGNAIVPQVATEIFRAIAAVSSGDSR